MGGILSHPTVGVASSYLFIFSVVAAYAYSAGTLDNFVARAKQYFRTTTPQTVEEETVDKIPRKRKGRNTTAKQSMSTSKHTDGSQINADGEGTSTSTPNTETQTSRKRKIASPTNEIAEVSTSPVHAAGPNGGNDMSDRDMARQLQQAQKGTNFKSSTNKNAAKTSRTSKLSAVETEPSGMSTETSSAGRDGDDDMSSPTESPALVPASTAATSRVGDPIGDMLEPTPEGPKSLRILPSDGWETQKQKQKAKPAAKQPEVQETKKQRAARRKREEQAIEVQRTNEEHKRKGEQQMRANRMAEGTAKQSKATTFQQSVWAGGNKAQENAVKRSPTNVENQIVLDTFESKSSANEPNEGGVTAKPLSAITNQSTMSAVNGLRANLGAAKTSAIGASSRENGIKPESSSSSQADDAYVNEQIRSIQKQHEEAGSWETVSSKKDKKKVRKDTDTSSEASGLLERVNSRGSGKTKKPAVNSSSNRYKGLGAPEGVWGTSETAWDDQKNDEWAS